MTAADVSHNKYYLILECLEQDINNSKIMLKQKTYEVNLFGAELALMAVI